MFWSLHSRFKIIKHIFCLMINLTRQNLASNNARRPSSGLTPSERRLRFRGSLLSQRQSIVSPFARHARARARARARAHLSSRQNLNEANTLVWSGGNSKNKKIAAARRPLADRLPPLRSPSPSPPLTRSRSLAVAAATDSPPPLARRRRLAAAF